MPIPANLTDDQKNSVLKEVLAGDSFKEKPQQSRLLKWLVEQEIRGIAVTEHLIGFEFFKIPDFQSDLHSNARVATASLRGSLKGYYAREGKSSYIRIDLPKGRYTLVFVEWQPDKPLLDFGPRQIQRPRVGRASVGFLILSLVIVLALGLGLWSFDNRDCDPSVTLSLPTRVHLKETVAIKRESPRRFCRCNDYLVVEPSGLDEQMWIQGRFTNGFQSHLTATFGEPDTPSGTRFTVFVLTTKQILRPGLLTGPAPLLADAVESGAVEVILDKP